MDDTFFSENWKVKIEREKVGGKKENGQGLSGRLTVTFFKLIYKLEGNKKRFSREIKYRFHAPLKSSMRNAMWNALWKKENSKLNSRWKKKKKMNSKLNAFSIIYWVEEKKREWVQMRVKRERDLRLGNSSGQSWWGFLSTIIPKTVFFFLPRKKEKLESRWDVMTC